MSGLLTVLCVGVAVVAVLAWWFGADRTLRRALRAAPRVTIAAFPAGAPARIVGAVQPGSQLTAPLTGRACVFYEAVVELYEGNGQNGSWRTIIREARGVPFALDDGTGVALVDPAHAQLAVVKDSVTRSGTFDDATPVEEAFLARHDRASRGAWFNKSLRYREGALEIGERIAVAGVAVREPDPDGAGRATGYRDPPPTRLRLTGSPRQPLLISDHDDTTR